VKTLTAEEARAIRAGSPGANDPHEMHPDMADSLIARGYMVQERIPGAAAWWVHSTSLGVESLRCYDAATRGWS